jgi:hypothetical protein
MIGCELGGRERGCPGLAAFPLRSACPSRASWGKRPRAGQARDWATAVRQAREKGLGPSVKAEQLRPRARMGPHVPGQRRGGVRAVAMVRRPADKGGLSGQF